MVPSSVVSCDKLMSTIPFSKSFTVNRVRILRKTVLGFKNSYPYIENDKAATMIANIVCMEVNIYG